jgi:Flp pilus assembly protein TadD
MRLFEVNLGFGRPVFERRLGDFWIVINLIPCGGRVRTMPRSRSWFRLRYWLCFAAGPLANLLAAACVWPHVYRHGLVSLGHGLHPAFVFFGANLVMAFSNLIPHRVQSQFGVTGSDGLQLLRIPFMTREKISTLLAMRLGMEGFAARRAGDFETAGRWYQQGISEYPDSFMVRNDAAVNLLDQGRLDEARGKFVETLESPALKPLEKALTQNNLAYVNVRLARNDLLDEADRLSQEALAVFPAAAFARGTRGSVLCRLGRFDDGVPMLKQAMKEHVEPKNKALIACELALAEKSLGNLESSEAYWKAARALDPRCPMLPSKSPAGTPRQ